MASTATPEDVLTFWFGTPGTDSYGAKQKLWFNSTPAFDADILSSFGGAIEAALAGGLKDWETTTRGLQAKILVLDQFTRNTFRGTAKAFAGDTEALRCAIAVVESAGGLSAVPDREQLFVLLPFMHSEDLAVQKRGEDVEFPKLAGYGPGSYIKHEVEGHRLLVERFGRFPHRNAALGRVSTPAEVEYLAAPTTRTYGQATATAATAAAAAAPGVAATAASSTTTTA